jgi:hypothetical protein
MAEKTKTKQSLLTDRLLASAAVKNQKHHKNNGTMEQWDC